MMYIYLVIYQKLGEVFETRQVYDNPTSDNKIQMDVIEEFGDIFICKIVKL